MKASDIFNLPQSLATFKNVFDENLPPWEWLKLIKTALASLDFSKLESKKDIPVGVSIKGYAYIHPTVKLPPFAAIEGPCWIGANTEIRPGAYVRGNVIVGENCVLGNSCEYKNSLLMDNVATPHYNYVGDSILGTGAHLGAGVILANLRLDKANIVVQTPEGRVNTDLRKIGALMGEYSEAGCNAVLQPGTILMKRAIVMSTLAFTGLLEENMIAADRPTLRKVPRPRA